MCEIEAMLCELSYGGLRPCSFIPDYHLCGRGCDPRRMRCMTAAAVHMLNLKCSSDNH